MKIPPKIAGEDRFLNLLICPPKFERLQTQQRYRPQVHLMPKTPRSTLRKRSSLKANASPSRLKRSRSLSSLNISTNCIQVTSMSSSRPPLPPLDNKPPSTTHLRRTLSSPNSGWKSNSSTLIFFIFLEYLVPSLSRTSSLRSSFNNCVKKKKGNIDLILLSMNLLSDTIDQHPDWSLSKCCDRVHQHLSFNEIKGYSRPTLMAHWKRLHSHPENYDGKHEIFPASLGRQALLSEEQQHHLINAINSRISEQRQSYPSIINFQSIAYNLFGHRFSASWMSSFLKRHKFFYGKPIESKSGTRYHDSEIVIQERLDFICHKIWYIAWERQGLCTLFVDDESWINEKPSGLQVWSSDYCKPGKKSEGRRFAFSSLWCLANGLSTGHPQIDELPSLVRSLKCQMDGRMDDGPTEIISLFRQSSISPSTSLTIDSKNTMIIPQNMNSTFFLFDVKTAAQNRGVSRQMDSSKFLWRIEQNIRFLATVVPNQKMIVLQLDNARYHRELADASLRKIIDIYPRKRRDDTYSISMIDKLKEWKFKPSWASDDWWQVKRAKFGSLSKNKTPEQKKAILLERQEINDHKASIRKYFRMAPQYRHAETRVELLAEQLTDELDRKIKIIWGARGHSELAEIEFSWNFMKRFVKQNNPINAKETTALLKISEILDSVNGLHWRKHVLINTYCYIMDGYFTSKLRRKYESQWESIRKYFDSVFDDIYAHFKFTLSEKSRFADKFKSKFVRQLTYEEIQQHL